MEKDLQRLEQAAGHRRQLRTEETQVGGRGRASGGTGRVGARDFREPKGGQPAPSHFPPTQQLRGGGLGEYSWTSSSQLS